MSYYVVENGHLVQQHPAKGQPGSMLLNYAAVELARHFLSTEKGILHYGGIRFLDRFVADGKLTPVARLVADWAAKCFSKNLKGFFAARRAWLSAGRQGRGPKPPGIMRIRRRRFTFGGNAEEIRPLFDFLGIPMRLLVKRADSNGLGETSVDFGRKDATGPVTVTITLTRDKPSR
jgi:hypothetical protein